MKAKTIKQVLIATRYILDNYGWCQGSYYQFKDGTKIFSKEDISPHFFGGSCLSGAIDLVETSSTIKDATFNLVDKAVGDSQNIPQFNDVEGRTKDEILAFLDKLIKKA